MSNLIEQDEYLVLKEQLETTRDYRKFIEDNSGNQDSNIQYLVIKASYLSILQEKKELFYSLGLRQFIEKNEHNTDTRVRVLVTDVMFRLLKVEYQNLTEEKILEEMNSIIEYSSSIFGHYDVVSKVLIRIYWYKAQHILERDWRKTQYFYNKVILLVKSINDPKYIDYLVQAKIAKLALDIQFDPSDKIEQKFYDLIELYLSNENTYVQKQIKNLVIKYITYIANHNENLKEKYWKNLLKEMNENQHLKQLILDLEPSEIDIKILLFIGQQYWIKSNKLFEEFFFRYFAIKQNKDHLKDVSKDYLVFESEEQYTTFVKMLEDLYERYISLTKYRKLFRIGTAK